MPEVAGLPHNNRFSEGSLQKKPSGTIVPLRNWPAEERDRHRAFVTGNTQH